MNCLFKRALDHCINFEQKQISVSKPEAKNKYHVNRINAMNRLSEEYESVLTSEKKLIYVCSPFAGGNKGIEGNIEMAKIYSRKVVSEGGIPFTPHLFFPQFLSEKTERHVGCELGLVALERCDEIWVFGPERTPGMKQEIIYAEKLGVPVRYLDENGKKAV